MREYNNQYRLYEPKRREIRRMMRLILSALVVIGVSFAWIAPPVQSQAAMPNPAKVAELKMALRDLYINHVFWVRSLAISTRLGEKTASARLTSTGSTMPKP